VRLTVLGSSASYAAAGQACSGYLVEHDGTAVLLDCGNGVLAHLVSVVDPLALRGVFVSHSHPDHFLDIYSLQALLRYAPQGPAAPLEVYLPDGLFERMTCLLSDRGVIEFAAAFNPHALADRVPVSVGPFTIEPRLVDHTDHSFAFRVTDGTAALCYTADTAYGPRALEAATDADVLLAEATLPEEYAGIAPHMTASEAGALAREAGVHTLVLTHVWPTNDRERMADDAHETFGGRVVVAREFDVFEIGPKGPAREERTL